MNALKITLEASGGVVVGVLGNLWRTFAGMAFPLD